MTVSTVVCVGVVVGLAAGQSSPEAHENSVFSLVARNASGTDATFNVNGALDLNNPFFRSWATNGRSCVTCHVRRRAGRSRRRRAGAVRRTRRHRPDLPHQRRLELAEGADVVDVAQRRPAYSMLLTRGLIRVGLACRRAPSSAGRSVNDPYGYAAPTSCRCSAVRCRPPTCAFLSAVMWDGREIVRRRPSSSTISRSRPTTRPRPRAGARHLTAAAGEDDRRLRDRTVHGAEPRRRRRRLREDGARRRPASHCREQPFFIGINDPRRPAIREARRSTRARSRCSTRGQPAARTPRARRRDRARPGSIFNTQPIRITGVGGPQRQTFRTASPSRSINGTCTTCHDTPNVGNHSVRRRSTSA